MLSFGKKLAVLRKEQKLSQTELAKLLNTSVSVISRYERDEMMPSIATGKKIAEILNTTVGYLLGETEESTLFKDPKMVERFQDISGFDKKEQEFIFFALDAMIRDIKTRRSYGIS